MRKTILLLTYFKREFQLRKTLDSLSKSKHTNFEVIILDDGSPVEKANEMEFNYSFPIHVMYITDKNWTDP